MNTGNIYNMTSRTLQYKKTKYEKEGKAENL